jgi:hypothetical protein
MSEINKLNVKIEQSDDKIVMKLSLRLPRHFQNSCRD